MDFLFTSQVSAEWDTCLAEVPSQSLGPLSMVGKMRDASRPLLDKGPNKLLSNPAGGAGHQNNAIC
jgi:hypothetical protein